MCLDPRPDRLFRTVRSLRPSGAAAPRRRPFTAPPPAPVVVRAPALWALEHLAGDDELVARGWVVLSRES